jgi:hypothetical protein
MKEVEAASKRMSKCSVGDGDVVAEALVDVDQ